MSDFFKEKKGYIVYFGVDKRNAVTLPHSAQRKHAFTGKINNMSKKNKFPARKKIALESIITLMNAGHTCLFHKSVLHGVLRSR